jgi:hypothetical protein
MPRCPARARFSPNSGGPPARAQVVELEAFHESDRLQPLGPILLNLSPFDRFAQLFELHVCLETICSSLRSALAKTAFYSGLVSAATYLKPFGCRFEQLAVGW